MSDQDLQLPATNTSPAADETYIMIDGQPVSESASPPAHEAYYGHDFEAAEAESGQLPRVIWLAVRDRLHWLVICAVVLGSAAGVATYFGQKPLYQATAQFHIKPYVPGMKDTEFSGIPPMWKDYIGFQHNLIQNPLIIERAMNSKIWQDIKLQKEDEAGSFAKYLDVDVDGGLFTVSNQNYDREAAQASVNALVGTFVEVFNERQSRQEDEVLKNKTQQRFDKEAQIVIHRQKLASLTGNRGVSDLRMQHATAMRELQRISQLISDNRLRLKMLMPINDPEARAKMTETEIALRDPMMQQMINDLNALDREINMLQSSGYGPGHMSVTRKLQQREGLRARIKAYADDYRMGIQGETTVNPMVGQEINQIKSLLAELTKQYDELNVDVSTLSEKLRQVETEELQIVKLEGETEELRRDISNIIGNRELSGRIDIVSSAQLPVGSPVNGKKRIQMSVMAGLGGVCMGAGMIVLIGLFDKSLRRASDAQQELPQVRMLGVLPTLPANLTDPEQAELASHTVHHIRTLLQIDHDEISRVYATTGASAGSGKSSLTLALGLSFANSGARTLLIDGDFIGGGLSHRILGDHIGGRGIADVCAGLALGDCVIAVPGVKNLHVLTLGEAGPNDAATLSPKSLKRIIATARGQYEVVLIDCGPVLGSLEASMSAAEADGVIMVVSRGDQKTAVTRSVEHIRSLGAQLEGLVFNHALDYDVERSNYGSVSKARSQGPRPAPVFDSTKSERYGPLGLAVAAYSGVEPVLGGGETRTGAA